jgi:hypothetical protein
MQSKKEHDRKHEYLKRVLTYLKESKILTLVKY